MLDARASGMLVEMNLMTRTRELDMEETRRVVLLHKSNMEAFILQWEMCDTFCFYSLRGGTGGCVGGCDGHRSRVHCALHTGVRPTKDEISNQEACEDDTG